MIAVWRGLGESGDERGEVLLGEVFGADHGAFYGRDGDVQERMLVCPWETG